MIQLLVPALMRGSVITLEVWAGAAVLGIIAALTAGIARLAPVPPVRWVATAYVEVFRGTSALVQLFWLYFALPLLGVDLSALVAGILALGLNSGAYGAEVVRGAIRAVPRGQWEASTALNMSPWTRMRYVIVPQAMVAMLPPAGNLLIELLKNTALVSLITLADLTFEGQLLRADTMKTGQIFGSILIVYFVFSQVIARGIRVIERRATRGRRLGTVG